MSNTPACSPVTRASSRYGRRGTASRVGSPTAISPFDTRYCSPLREHRLCPHCLLSSSQLALERLRATGKDRREAREQQPTTDRLQQLAARVSRVGVAAQPVDMGAVA